MMAGDCGKRSESRCMTQFLLKPRYLFYETETVSRSRNAMSCSPRWGQIPSNARASIPSTIDGGSAAAVR